ncbi:MAG: DUF4402 domain-containing protein [Myxococcota bacterium]
MKTRLSVRILATVSALSLLAAPAFAIDLISIASLDLVAPLAITEQTPMYFGIVSPPTNNAQNIYMTYSATVGSSGLVMDAAGDGKIVDQSNTTAAFFMISGAPSQTFSLNCTQNADWTGGITWAGWDTEQGASTPVTNSFDGNGVYGTNGAQGNAIGIGATITIPAGMTAGNYTGTFTMTLVYN